MFDGYILQKIRDMTYKCGKNSPESCAIFLKILFLTEKTKLTHFLKFFITSWQGAVLFLLNLITGVNKFNTNQILNIVCLKLQEEGMEENIKIGGEGNIVQIDEAKNDKRKFERGHVVEVVWIFGKLRLQIKGNSLQFQLKKRDSNTLNGLFLKHILPGSVVL